MLRLSLIGCLLLSPVLFFSCCQECSHCDGKEAFCQLIEEQIKTIEDKIAELEKSAAGLGEEVQAKLKEQIAGLRVLKRKAQEKLTALKTSGSEAWEDMQPSLNEAVNNLKDAFEKARSHF